MEWQPVDPHGFVDQLGLLDEATTRPRIEAAGSGPQDGMGTITAFGRNGEDCGASLDLLPKLVLFERNTTGSLAEEQILVIRGAGWSEVRQPAFLRASERQPGLPYQEQSAACHRDQATSRPPVKLRLRPSCLDLSL